ncbi:MAG: Gfo/Idh/MocA family oxidoreductase [Anaerolineae bacterium]|nr:Gfo/Idh/MocA family oxidoreductase [Anaerolineae bacterium]
MSDKLSIAIVGYRGMGRGLAKTAAALDEYEMIAGCDLVEERLRDFEAAHPGAKGYTDFAQMLAEAKPDVVIVATNNVTHARLTIQAAEAGVRGIYCEKPMAANYADAQRMVEVCHQNGVALAVNHQRRLLPVFQKMRQLIDSGVLGDITLIRASCAGDVLSDGTHLIDTVRHLSGDDEVKTVFGQVYRLPPDPNEPKASGYDVSGGYRYGHPIENGAMAVLDFAGGLRAEIFTGGIQPKGGKYQMYEVFGTQGRLYRNGDAADPPVVMQDQSGAGWQAVDVSGTADSQDAIGTSLKYLARTIQHGDPHPLSGDSALKVQEVVMAIYESARLRQRIELPLQQPRFPLEIMVENGEL